MLEIIIPETELWDHSEEEFYYTKKTKLKLEHSLISLSKWETKWQKPFLSKDKKTREETIDYIKCMTITQNVQPEVFNAIDNKIMTEINKYIDNPMTATTFSNKDGGKKNRKIVTSEVIYYWLTALNIPFECQKWHLNRLLTLVNVCNIKSQPNKKKMSRREILTKNRELNAKRRKALGTKG